MSSKQKNNLLSWIIIPLLFIIIIISMKIVMQGELKIDLLAYNILVEKLRNPSLTNVMKIVTKFSDTLTIIVFAILAMIFFLSITKNKKLALLIPYNLIIVVAINQLLKFLFQRERPTGYRIIEMSGYSFPSGHAMVSMAFYGLLVYIIYRTVKNKKLKILFITINVAIILLIGISRVYLGVHYLSDVITGYSISLIYLILLAKWLNRHHYFP